MGKNHSWEFPFPFSQSQGAPLPHISLPALYPLIKWCHISQPREQNVFKTRFCPLILEEQVSTEMKLKIAWAVISVWCKLPHHQPQNMFVHVQNTKPIKKRHFLNKWTPAAGVFPVSHKILNIVIRDGSTSAAFSEGVVIKTLFKRLLRAMPHSGRGKVH